MVDEMENAYLNFQAWPGSDQKSPPRSGPSGQVSHRIFFFSGLLDVFFLSLSLSFFLGFSLLRSFTLNSNCDVDLLLFNGVVDRRYNIFLLPFRIALGLVFLYFLLTLTLTLGRS